jgi:hypothetical protein
MTAVCQLRANLATTYFFQLLIYQLHACPAHKELSLLQKIRPLAHHAAPAFFLQSIGLLRRKHANSAPLALTAHQDQCYPPLALWANTVSLDHPGVSLVSRGISRLFWAQHLPAVAELVHRAPMHHPPAFQVVQDALMANSVIPLRRSSAKDAPSGSTPDLRDHHHSAIASLVLPALFGLKAAAHLVLLEHTIPVSDQWMPVLACSVLRDSSAASDPVLAEHARQGLLHLKLDLQHAYFVLLERIHFQRIFNAHSALPTLFLSMPPRLASLHAPLAPLTRFLLRDHLFARRWYAVLELRA